jgi:hypothetical protein
VKELTKKQKKVLKAVLTLAEEDALNEPKGIIAKQAKATDRTVRSIFRQLEGLGFLVALERAKGAPVRYKIDRQGIETLFKQGVWEARVAQKATFHPGNEPRENTPEISAHPGNKIPPSFEGQLPQERGASTGLAEVVPPPQFLSSGAAPLGGTEPILPPDLIDYVQQLPEGVRRGLKVVGGAAAGGLLGLEIADLVGTPRWLAALLLTIVGGGAVWWWTQPVRPKEESPPPLQPTKEKSLKERLERMYGPMSCLWLDPQARKTYRWDPRSGDEPSEVSIW